MQYNIKAIPTSYAGVNFRSRLEARWAAFFDLCGWKWDYEPFDLDGWAPDFKLTIGGITALAEVKPYDLNAAIEKAIETNHSNLDLSIFGDSPIVSDGLDYPIAIGVPTDDILDDNTYLSLLDALAPFDVYDQDPGDRGNALDTWREAGNLVQWSKPMEAPYQSPLSVVRRAGRRAS